MIFGMHSLHVLRYNLSPDSVPKQGKSPPLTARWVSKSLTAPGLMRLNFSFHFESFTLSLLNLKYSTHAISPPRGFKDEIPKIPDTW